MSSESISDSQVSGSQNVPSHNQGQNIDNFDFEELAKLPDASLLQKADEATNTALEEITKKASSTSRLTVAEGLKKFGKGIAAFFGGTLAIFGGGTTALALGLIVISALPGAGIGASFGAAIGAIAGKAKGDVKVYAEAGAILGAQIGAAVTAIPVALALLIPGIIAMGLAKAGEKLLEAAYSKKTSEGAPPLQVFANAMSMGTAKNYKVLSENKDDPRPIPL